MVLSVVGWYRVTRWQPSAINSWISWVPEALSSISTLGGVEQVLLLAHRAFERRIFEPLAQQAQQVKVLAPHTPGRTDAEVAELGRLVGGVPALHDVLEALRPLVLAVALEPCFLDQPAAQGCRGLLILTSEIVLADRPSDVLESGERLARGVQRLAVPPGEALRPPIVAISCTSLASAIAGKHTTSHGSW